MPNSVFEKIIQGGAKVAEDAAPVVGGVIGGAFGGPAGAAAGAAAGRAVSGGIKKVASIRALGGAGSVQESKQQDHARMAEQYGIGYGN